MNAHSKPSGIRTILMIVVIALLLLGGIGITGAAAQSAIPGDALYSVKTSIEQTRLSMAKDAGDRAQLKLSFAELRLEEISLLIKEGRYREIKKAVLSFEASINSTIMELETVSKGDPARAAVLAKEITAALTRYAQVLSELAASAPDSIKDDVTRALDSTQLAGSLDMPSADDNANANANDNGDDNSNGNANANSNDNANTNDNGDDRGNDNANINNNGDDNGNDNGDDHGNDNANVNNNGDDNGNDNGDDHGNDNANVNNNGDDSSNSNSNDDRGGNSGGGDDSGNSNDDNSGKGKDGG